MPAAALVFLLLSALLHTSWNLFIKQAGDRLAATWWALLIVAALTTPLLWFFPVPLATAWVFLVPSLVAEFVYLGVLLTSYRDGDFSVVYPIARGAAPALLAVWAVVFLGETPTAGGALGLSVVVVGLLVVGGSGLVRQNASQKKPNPWVVAGALLAAFSISVYTAIDGAAMKSLHPIGYNVLVYQGIALGLTPVVLRRFPRPVLARAWRAHWRGYLGMGLASFGSYALALAAYRIAPVSYAGAVREISIVFGALAGWLLLGEGLGKIRALGAAVIFAGILLIALQ